MDIWHEVMQSISTPPAQGAISSYGTTMFIIWVGVAVAIIIRWMRGLLFADSKAISTGIKLTAILSVAYVGAWLATRILQHSIQLGLDSQALSPIDSLSLEIDQLMLRLVSGGVAAVFVAIVSLMCWNMLLGRHRDALKEGSVASPLSQP